MSARTKVIPFVVEVDKLRYANTIPTALTASNVPATVERMKRYETYEDFPFVLIRPDQHIAWRGRELPEDPRAFIDRVRGA